MVAQDYRSRVRETIEVVWQHRSKSIFVALVVFAVAATNVVLTSKVYEASARILVEAGRETSARADLASSTSHWRSDTERLIHNELQILRSRELAERFLELYGYEKLYPELSEVPLEQQLQAATKRFLEDLEVRAFEGTDTIEISLSHRDPDVAVAALAVFTEVFRDRHLEVYSEPGLGSFLADQVELYELALDRAEEELRTFRLENEGFASLEDQELAVRQRREIEAVVEEQRARIAGLERKVASLVSQKNDIEAQVALYSEEDPSLSEARQRLLELQLQEQELRGTFKPSNRQIENVRKRIDMVESFLEENEGRAHTRVGSNAVFREVEQERIVATSELASERAAVGALEVRLGELEQRLRVSATHEATYRELIRVRDDAERNLLTYTQRLDEARLALQMDERGLASIMVIDPASSDFKAVGPSRKLLLAMGLAFALGLALLTPFVAEALSTELGDAERTGRALGIPVLGTVDAPSEEAA